MFRRTGVVHGIVGNIDVAESIVDLKYVPLESSGRPPSQFWEFFLLVPPNRPTPRTLLAVTIIVHTFGDTL